MQRYNPAPWCECQRVLWCWWGGGTRLSTVMLCKVACQFGKWWRLFWQCTVAVFLSLLLQLKKIESANCNVAMAAQLSAQLFLKKNFILWRLLDSSVLCGLFLWLLRGFPTRTCKANSQAVLLGADYRSGSGPQVLHHGSSLFPG